MLYIVCITSRYLCCPKRAVIINKYRQNILVCEATVIFNVLQPTGHVKHQQFNIQQLYVLPHCFHVFCIYLRTNSDLCHLLIGFL